VPPTQALRERFGDDDDDYYYYYYYYMLWHQVPGRSEAELEADLRGNLAKIFAPAERAQDLWVMATVGGEVNRLILDFIADLR